MFNYDGFTPVRSMTLPNGEYECIIRKVEDIDGTYGTYRKVTVQARGKKGWTPNLIMLNDRPILGTVKNNGKVISEDDLRRWDRNITTFLDAFGITKENDDRETFNPSKWVGKIGWCKVAEQYDPNEPDKKSKKFKELFPFVKVEEPPVQAPEENLYPGAPVDFMPPDDEIPF